MLTAKRLRELLSYDELTGEFRRLSGRGGKKKGSIAGTPNCDGYVQICIDKKHYLAHRLAWLYVHGEWPQDQIDHRFGIRNDNRFSEIRESNVLHNAQNKRSPHRPSKSGLLGVAWDASRSKWHATIKVDGIRRSLGRFNDAGQAYSVYLNAKRQLHAGCTL